MEGMHEIIAGHLRLKESTIGYKYLAFLFVLT